MRHHHHLKLTIETKGTHYTNSETENLRLLITLILLFYIVISFLFCQSNEKRIYLDVVILIIRDTKNIKNKLGLAFPG